MPRSSIVLLLLAVGFAYDGGRYPAGPEAGTTGGSAMGNRRAEDARPAAAAREMTSADRKRVIRALPHPDREADPVPLLGHALVDEDPRVRNAALDALLRAGGDEALAGIASASRHAEPVFRARAAEALGRAGGPSAAEYLALVLEDPDPRVRVAAVEALGDIGDTRSLNIIGQALRDGDPGVRQQAAEVLEGLEVEALFYTRFPRP